MPLRCVAVVAIAFAFSVVPNSLCGEGPLKPMAPESVAAILKWLPENSETLIVAQGPFEFPAEGPPGERSFVDTARTLACGLPLGMRNKTLATKLAGLKISLAVEGSRRFTAPDDIGMMPYEGCQVLLFDESTHDDLQAAVDACLEEAPATIDIDGTKIAVFEERHIRTDWTFLVASPEPGLLLCATSESYLKEVLAGRKEERARRPAFPDDLPEWRHIDVQAPVWGLRHYRKEFAADDPSSPLQPKAAANVPDSQAIGFTFWIGGEDGKVAKARYLTGPEDSDETHAHLKGRWNRPSERLASKVAEIAPGVFEITATIDPATHGGPMFLFMTMMYLGHGLFL